MTEQAKPVMGIGSCLAGNAVRYNGQTKSANDHVRSLSEAFEMRSFCPEMAIGLGTPRESLRLVMGEEGVRCVGNKTETLDVTDRLLETAHQQAGRRSSEWSAETVGSVRSAARARCVWDGVRREHSR